MGNLIGQTVQGYDLLERIGSGGYGAVYRAYQSTVGREVAVKVILPAHANEPAFIRRFEIEAQLVARLEHLHIVPLYDYWRDPNGAYIVMRWLRGGSLGAALQGSAFDLEPAALLLDQVAAGLAAAHSQQIVHRDLKPSNILLDEEGNAYLADFGIARDLRWTNGTDGGDRTDRQRSSRGERVLGSFRYLSPEQLRGQAATPQSDIYSLGVSLYEIVSGQHPFPSLNSVQQLYKQIEEPLPRIDTLEPGVSDRVNQVIQKASAKNPRHRFEDALALTVAFRRAAGLNRDDQTADLVESLTRREQEILHLIIEGNTNQEIAQALYLELSTVKWHINRIYKKLGVRSRVQAIVRARELDLIVSSNGAELELGGETSLGAVLPEPINPYKGLRAFEPADNRDFYGREALIEKLLSRLATKSASSPKGAVHDLAANGSERFLAIVGPSGSGKSSLIKAGLIPALWSGRLAGSGKWFIVNMLPGAHPLDALEVALTRIAADQADNLRAHLDRDAHGLARAARLILPNDSSELVLFIDQFEELFTLVEQETARQHFMDLILGALTDPRSHVRVIIALRADYFDRPLQYPVFGDLICDHLETLLPLSAEELERAIVNPAHQAGVTFESGLVASIIEDVVYRPGALPLLQYAFAELFEQRDGRLLTQSAYLTIGGVAGALARRAEELYQEQDADGREAIRQMFLRMVSVGDQVVGTTYNVPSSDIRKRVLRSELLSVTNNPEWLDEIIDTYAAYRLFSLDYHSSTRRATVEVAHEAILREWDRLQDWLDESRADLRLHHQLVQATREWIDAGSDQSFLLRGARLKRFESWVRDTSLVLTESERSYLKASIDQRGAREAAEHARNAQKALLERQANRRLKALVVVMAVALLVAVGLAIAAVSFAKRVEEQQRLVEQKDRQSLALELASAARSNLNLDPEFSLLLALQAAETTHSVDGTVLPEVESLLHQAVQGDFVRLTIRDGGVIAMSPDGKTLAIGNQFGRVRLRNADTGKIISRLSSPVRIREIAFSPDGRFLATVRLDSAVNLWDVRSGKMLGFIKSTHSINSLAFNPHSQQIVTAGGDGAIRIWDLAPFVNGSRENVEPDEISEPVKILEMPGQAVDIVYDSAGRRLAVHLSSGRIIVLDPGTGKQLFAIDGVGSFSTGVTFSPGGDFIASGSGDRYAIVWHASTGEAFLTVRETTTISAVAFSPDGRYLATATENGEVTLWDMKTGLETLKLSGHSSRIIDTLFSPDGQFLLTSDGASLDSGMTSIWDLSLANGELYTIAAHEGRVHDAIYNAVGTKIASTGEDGMVKVWDSATGKLLRSLPGQVDWMHFPAFSPDGQRLAAANRDNGITIWDVDTGEELLTLRGDAPAYTAVTFSPDGTRLAAGGREGIAHIWNAATGKRLTDIRHDGGTIIELIFSADGEVIRSYDREGHEFDWDTATGKRLGSVDRSVSNVLDVEFSADGQLGAMASMQARIFHPEYQPASEENLYMLGDNAKEVTGVAFNPDGTILATSFSSGGVKLWDMDTGDEMMTLSDRLPPLGRIDISPDGRYLLTAGVDGTVSVFVLSVDELMQVARSRLSRGFTLKECQTYLHLSACVEEQ